MAVGEGDRCRPAERLADGSKSSLSQPSSRTQCIDELVTHVSSFPNPGLLRGSNPLVLLQGFGAILANSEGSAKTYAMSAKVQRLDEFVSHNWCTPRCAKFLTLLLYFNLSTAVACALAVSLVFFVLTVADLLPLSPMADECETAGQMGFYCMAFGNLGLIMGLFCGRRLLSPLACCRRVVFFDKTCIHQTDHTLKQQGIASLAAFLHSSERMVVVYTDEYLRRLWTVYEVASFLTFKSQNSIVVEPVYRPIIFSILSLSTTISIISWNVMGLQTVEFSHLWPRLSGALLPVGAGICTAGRLLEQTRVGICQRVRDFSIARAACAAESDRELVESNVDLFMRHLGRVPERASHSEAMAAFDELVREAVPEAVAASLGQNAIPYRLVVLSTLTVPMMFLDHLAAKLRRGASARAVAVYVLCALDLWLLVVPAAAALGGRAGGRSLRFRGWALWLYMAAAGLLACAGTCLLWMLIYELRTRAYPDDADVWLGLVLATTAALVALDCCLYRAPAVTWPRASIEPAGEPAGHSTPKAMPMGRGPGEREEAAGEKLGENAFGQDLDVAVAISVPSDGHGPPTESEPALESSIALKEDGWPAAAGGLAEGPSVGAGQDAQCALSGGEGAAMSTGGGSAAEMRVAGGEGAVQGASAGFQGPVERACAGSDGAMRSASAGVLGMGNDSPGPEGMACGAVSSMAWARAPPHGGHPLVSSL